MPMANLVTKKMCMHVCDSHYCAQKNMLTLDQRLLRNNSLLEFYFKSLQSAKVVGSLQREPAVFSDDVTNCRTTRD